MNRSRNYIYKSLIFFFLSIVCFAKQDSISFYFNPISVLGKNQKNQSEYLVHIIQSSLLKKKSNSLTLNSAIESVPGITIFSNQNFAQDTRISIRGVGLRSSFGIRGIKVFLDGVPESTPDGQAQLDAIDLIFLNAINIFKNPSSGVFGNASGAALNLISNPLSNGNNNKLNICLGSHDSKKVNIELNGFHKIFKWRLNGLHKFSKGFRQHSSTESNILNMSTEFILKGNQRFKISLNNLFSPFSYDPGALILDEANEDRSRARAANIDYQSGESVFQSKFSLIYNSTIFKKYNLRSYFFYLKRQFQNKLPFQSGGQSDLARNYVGFSSVIEKESIFLKNNNKISMGFEYLDQLDIRSRYDNIQGERGQLVYKKDESYESFGLFLYNILKFKNKHIFNFAIRYDQNLIDFEDYMLIGDRDNRQYHSFSPSLGLNFEIFRNFHLLSNFSQNFETPTLYELGNDPQDVSGKGINNNLEPQNSFSSEIGFERKLGDFKKAKWSSFQTRTIDEIIPFELAEIPGRTFYRNSGKTLKNGYELELIGTLVSKLNYTLSYTKLNFRFTDYKIDEGNLKGNFLPLISEDNFYLEVEKIDYFGIDLSINILAKSSFYADDLNEHMIPGYKKVNISALKEIKTSRFNSVISLNIDNLLGDDFYDNIRSNAWGGRYYEPAYGRYFSLGLEILY